MDSVKKIISYLFETSENNGVEDVEHVEEIKKKKRTKTPARKLKDKINRKRKKRQIRNEKRIQSNIENNNKFGYDSPPEYVIDESTNEEIYYSTKQQAAETYKNKIIHKTNMTVNEFYKELEENKTEESKTEENKTEENKIKIE